MDFTSEETSESKMQDGCLANVFFGASDVEQTSVVSRPDSSSACNMSITASTPEQFKVWFP